MNTPSDRSPAGARLGFTLIEMLVVLGIIGILSSSLLGAFGYLKKTAWQSRAQQQVSLIATSLTVYLQNERTWPAGLQGRNEFDEEACWVLQQAKMLDVTTWKDYKGGQRNKGSLDRFGLLDPWGRAYLRQHVNASESDVKDHRLQYRLDKDFDGYVDASEGAPDGVRVRGSVLVWSRGPDGQDDSGSSNPKARARYPYDDRLSWNHGQARKDSN